MGKGHLAPKMSLLIVAFGMFVAGMTLPGLRAQATAISVCVNDASGEIKARTRRGCSPGWNVTPSSGSDGDFPEARTTLDPFWSPRTQRGSAPDGGTSTLTTPAPRCAEGSGSRRASPGRRHGSDRNRLRVGVFRPLVVHDGQGHQVDPGLHEIVRR